MITEAVLRFFGRLVLTVLSVLPDPAPPALAGMVGAVSPVWDGLAWLNNFVPLGDAVLYLGVYLTVVVVSYGLDVAVWVLTKAHVLGGSS